MSHPPAVVTISHVHMLVQNTALRTLKQVSYSISVVAKPAITIYRSISQSSLSISELSGLTDCGRTADQLCVGCVFFTRAVCPLLAAKQLVYLLHFLETSRFMYETKCQDTV